MLEDAHNLDVGKYVEGNKRPAILKHQSWPAILQLARYFNQTQIFMSVQIVVKNVCNRLL